MPIYEFVCNRCSEEFEKLVFSHTQVLCPKCGCPDIKKKPSAFGMRTAGRSGSGGGRSSCGTCGGTSCSSCH